MGLPIAAVVPTALFGVLCYDTGCKAWPVGIAGANAV
jgi:hypothetical protein